jgi:Ser/Thr protein kinase RdoA (MazF antagonist)
VRVLRLHGDCHPGNILWTPDAGPHFVDLDDARTGPAVQDLWMLLSGDRVQRQRQLGALLDGYEQMREFDRNELALIEPLRTLRLIHYSAWLARRWDDPAFPRAFPWFGTSDYWKGPGPDAGRPAHGSSSWRIATDSGGCEIDRRRAARPKCSSSASTEK